MGGREGIEMRYREVESLPFGSVRLRAMRSELKVREGETREVAASHRMDVSHTCISACISAGELACTVYTHTQSC